MDNDDFLILRSGEAVGLVTPGEALEAIEDAWREYGTARRLLSSPPALSLATGATRFKVKGAVLPAQNLAGFRLLTDSRDAEGRDASRGWFWLAEAEGGRPLALIEEHWLHCLRTAATGALAARLLTRPGATRAALIGAGRIAAHVPAVLAAALPGLTTLHVAARRPEAVAAFCAAAPADLSLALHAAPSIEAAVADADLVITLTSATSPVLHAAALRQGATVIGLGDTEMAADVLGWSDRFVVDDLVFALTVGSVGAWVAAGAATPGSLAARLDADVGEVVAGLKPGRQTAEQNLLAIIQGMAIGDLALAALAFRKARLRRLGLRFSLGEATAPRAANPTPRRNRSLR